jgi:hypothetical protein
LTSSWSLSARSSSFATAVGQAGIAEHDDRMQRMRQAAQVFLLFFDSGMAPV